MGPRLAEHRHRPLVERRRQLVGHHALVVDVDADRDRAELFEQVEHRRERGVFDDDPIAEAHDHPGDPVERVHRTVDHGELLGPERPSGAQPLVEGGQHGLVEVAGGEGLAADPGDHRAEVGQQRRVGGAGGQVEREVAGPLGDPSVAAR